MRDLFKLERQRLIEGICLANPDLLHAHWTYEFALACLDTGLPTLITSHNNAFRGLRYFKDLYRFGQLYLQIRVIRKARFLTAVSPYLANALRWLARTDIAVIPNAVEVLPREDWIGYDRPLEPVKVATVLNGWGDLKNPKAAIKAFNLLRNIYPSAEMYMYGYDFEHKGPAAQWTRDCGLSCNIYFCGYLPAEKLQRKLREMSILLHPSLEESFGMALIEAMALGLPVIAGMNSGAVPWVLAEGQCGYLTDVRKPKKIAEALLTCITQPEDRMRRQRNAYERVLNVFSPKSVAVQYEKVYETVLSTSYRSVHSRPFPPLQIQGPEQLLGFLEEGHLGIPPHHQKKVVEAGSVGRGLQIPIHVGDIPPPPHKCDGHDQQAAVREIVPVKVPLQGPKEFVERGRHTYNAEP